MEDGELVSFATEEMERIGFISADDLLDSTVIRMPKAYPGYFGESYPGLSVSESTPTRWKTSF